jgi:glycosyltransferase involved in cell wall biosynthesis
MTVFNEADNIEGVLESLEKQSHPPDEIVIVDGGSTDGTLAILQQYAKNSEIPLKVLSQPGANISQGRNAAIEATIHELIAATDAGVKLSSDWLEKLVEPFSNQQPAASNQISNSSFIPHPSSFISQVVAGFFRADPDPRSPFEIAMGATVLPVVDEIDPEKFLPSSRSVAFTKAAWKAAGGYPEWLDYCEDVIFDLNLKKCGYKFYWQPQAVARFAPRRSLKAFWVQYYRYARGDGKSNLFFKRHVLRYLTYGVCAPLGILLAWRKPVLWLVLAACGLAYLKQPYKRLFFYLEEFKELPLSGKIAAASWVPIIRATGDLAKMAGYPVGVRWRKKNCRVNSQ